MSGNAAPRRAEVSLNAKRRLYELHDEYGTSWSRVKYAKTLFDEDLVEKQPDPASIGKMLKPAYRASVESKLLSQNDKRNSLTRQRKSPVEHLNEALKVWYNDLERKKAPLNDLVITEKARRLGNELEEKGLELPEHFNYSPSWLLNFKRDNSISLQVSHGESGSADQSSVRNARVIVPQLVLIFGLLNMFNADETGLYWRRLPNASLATARREGKKLNKSRYTLMVTVGATGDKMPLLIVATAMKPRSFPKNFDPKRDWGMGYYSNKSAWMDGEIWTKYLQHFRRYVNGRAGVEPNTKVCLLVDNAKCHIIPPNAKALPKELSDMGCKGFVWENITVIFFDPNATSVIQPCDMGVIAAFKAYYRRRLISWVVDEYEHFEGDNPVELEKLVPNTYQCLEWVRAAWREVSCETVKNCWAKAKILDVGTQADMMNMLAANGARGSARKKAPMPEEVKADVKEIERMMSVLGLLDVENAEDVGIAATVQDFLEPDIEDVVEDDAEVTDERLVAIATARQSCHMGETQEKGDDGGDEEDEVEEEPPLPPTLTLHQARRQAAALLQFCRENNGHVATELADRVGELSDIVSRMQVSARMKEKPLTSYFEKIDNDDQ